MVGREERWKEGEGWRKAETEGGREAMKEAEMGEGRQTERVEKREGWRQSGIRGGR